MCSHSAPPLIILLHSALSCPKSEARTEGEMIARGMTLYLVVGGGDIGDSLKTGLRESPHTHNYLSR
jgi:hypothetical protein